MTYQEAREVYHIVHQHTFQMINAILKIDYR